MKVYFYTLGCRVNQYETDAVRELFLKEGFEICDAAKDADVCVINTCTVTGEADRKSRQHIRRLAKENPQAIICAMGCNVEMTEGLVEADVICGTRDKNLLVERLKTYISEHGTVSDGNRGIAHKIPPVSKEDTYADFGTVLSPEGTRVFVKIEDGCNNFCTYCIIPFARGRVSSRSPESILAEIEELAGKGYSEFVLTGIHICSYGKDLGKDISYLSDLIHKAAQIDGVKRIRLGSLEPKTLTYEFIDFLASEPKICPHFHLSLQSGSDTVLKRMNRHYTSSEYMDKVNLLREKFPDMSLTTDVICGFPGETDEEFSETKKFIKDVKLNKIHVFPYSIRKGTVAAGMEQVSKTTAKERTSELLKISNEEEQRFAERFIGKEIEVLCEKFISEEGFLEGYSREYVLTKIFVPDGIDGSIYCGKIVNCVPLSSQDGVLIAEDFKN